MRNEVNFKSKFCLLNSQENSEDIIWSSSDSSGYENSNISEKTNNIIISNLNRKRKRKTKHKALKNISNLDISISDGSQETRESNNRSPILKSKHSIRRSESEDRNGRRFHCRDRSNSTSPVLVVNNSRNIFRSTSPILIPKSKPNSPIVCKRADAIEKKAATKCVLLTEVNNRTDSVSLVCKEDENNKTSIALKNNNNDKLLTKKRELINKVNSYFMDNYSSDSLSQVSISEYSTPKDSTKTSEDIEITTDISQKLSMPIRKESSMSMNSISEMECYFNSTNTVSKNKKIKLKKGGLAFRLNDLLKKRNANINMWQHERYLAVNSKFIIPNGSYVMFRIGHVVNKFGCFLLSVTDGEDDVYLILINQMYVRETIYINMILKLYQPYRIVDMNGGLKLIINVCKYELLNFDS